MERKEIQGVHQIKRDFASEWTKENPVLLDGQVGYEKDTRRQKVGDGVTPWNDLDYTDKYALDVVKRDYQPKGDYQPAGEYPTKQEVTEQITTAVTGGKVDLSGYATEKWVEDKHYLTSVPANVVTNENIENKLNDYKESHNLLDDTDIADMLTKTEAKSVYQPKGTYLTSIPDTYATKQDVDNRIENLIGTAPKELDTLGEIADALNNDAKAVDTILKEIGKKADASDLNDYQTKQEGTNILNQAKSYTDNIQLKTINGQSVKGSGNIQIEGGKAAADGVYIYYIGATSSAADSNICTIEYWKTLDKSDLYALGVLLIEGNQIFVISVNNFKGSTTNNSSIGIPVNNTNAAINDFDGYSNTQILYKTDGASDSYYAAYKCKEYERVNSRGYGIKKGSWYIPAFGELLLIYKNRDKINEALSVIDGADLLEDGWTISSTATLLPRASEEIKSAILYWMIYFSSPKSTFIESAGPSNPNNNRFIAAPNAFMRGGFYRQAKAPVYVDNSIDQLDAIYDDFVLYTSASKVSIKISMYNAGSTAKLIAPANANITFTGDTLLKKEGIDSITGTSNQYKVYSFLKTENVVLVDCALYK